MKLKYSLFAFAAILFFFSCKDEEIKSDSPFEFEKSFKINGEYKSDEHLLKFKVTEINDSRCPTDVICVWAGKADVKIEVESPVSGNLVLSTINNDYDTSIDTIGNYSFELIDVLPYPISTQVTDLEDYDVKLKVKKF